MERMKREYNCEVVSGEPAVNYKETVAARAPFNYLHKKQSGGSGQFARVIGYVEPLDEDELKRGIEFLFENHVVGTNIPPEFIPSCEKGARAACNKGALAGCKIYFGLFNVFVSEYTSCANIG
jgi:elongation factor G